MHRSPALLVSLLVGTLSLTACSENATQGLVSQFTGVSLEGPDEFLVLPQKPLEMPQDLTQLPTPTPGSANRVDLTPLVDAQIALTGRSVAATGMTRDDQALLAAAGAPNAGTNIRAVLASEDLELRQDKPGLFLERVVSSDIETITYADMTLDAQAELARLRLLGVVTPAVPELVQPDN